MSDISNDWLVVYRVEFESVVDAPTNQFVAPKGSDIWRFGPENTELDSQGFPIYQSKSWGGFASYPDYETAKLHASDPDSALSVDRAVKEMWTALLQPISHTGEVNWRGQVESNAAIKTPNQRGLIETNEPVVIITSAGFDSEEVDQLPRIANFTTNAERIRKDFEALQSNIKSSIFYAMHDGWDGLTFTLWQNSKAMRDAAYNLGRHSQIVYSHQQTPLVDRISTTCAKILHSSGLWHGINPLDR